MVRKNIYLLVFEKIKFLIFFNNITHFYMQDIDILPIK